MKQNKIIIWTSLLAGLMDSTTGVLLMSAPELTLRLMGIGDTPVDLVFLRFVGCFVFGVGSLYLLGIFSMIAGQSMNELRTVWKATAQVRGIVFVFTLLMIIQGELSRQWAGVPLADGSLAVFQVYWILSGRFASPS